MVSSLPETMRPPSGLNAANRWEETFQMLQNYAKEHRTSRVPYKYQVDGFRLGAWVTEQRSQYAKGKLDSSKSSRLEKLPAWTWNPPTGVWIKA